MKPFIFLALFSWVFLSSCCQTNKNKEMYTLFVGTYTDQESKGIYKYTFDPESGKIDNKSLAAELVNPSFIKISKDKKFLYSVEETNNGGGVSAFKIEGDSLVFLNSENSKGDGPCHIGLSKDDKTLAVSNYAGGSMTVMRIDNQGKLKNNTQFIDHKIIDSTKISHAHASYFTPDGLFTVDLGLDMIRRYQEKEGVYTEHTQPFLQLAEKAGPRHLSFSKDYQFLYVINELNSTISVFKRATDGNYKLIDNKSTLAEDFKGDSYCADIHLSKDGLFLYGSNRGENTIVVFKVSPENGSISLVGRESVKGDWPRNFSLDPSNRFLLVANQKSNNITVFKRDIEKGNLTFLHEIKTASPVCLEFLED